MQRPFGSRTLLAICAAFAILLAALAAVQYRWSTRVAAADAQREREHLDTAASLFAKEFNDSAVRVVEFLQNDVPPAIKSGERLAPLPKLVSELYYVEFSPKGMPRAKRLNPAGVFVPAPPPEWMPPAHCAAFLSMRPPVLVSPVFEVMKLEKNGAHEVRVVRSFDSGGQCLFAKLDEPYLRQSYFPELLKKSFGESSYSEYDFSVVPRDETGTPVYGLSVKPDIEKNFFAFTLFPPHTPPDDDPQPAAAHKNMIFVQRYQSMVVTAGPSRSSLFLGDGVWQLRIAHKGVPLALAFEQTRRRNLLLSLGVEALLGAAMVFLIIGVRRTQRLAEQKMQFVAAVSHELRAPVSAISMLSRNQADGLVAGPQRVQQYGELIHQQSRRLNEMVEQTLQYAGIHSNLGRVAKTEVDLKRLINEAINARRDELSRLGFEIVVETANHLPPIYGDPKLLRIAIDNLLSNAEKYAETGRWIAARAEYSAASKEVLIEVEDRGPGIAADDQAEIFQPFCRGQAAIDAQIPGSGIGLSLVRSAAEAHRGTVTLVSEPGHGCTFTLHLPV